MIGTNTNQSKRYTWRGTCVALLSVLTILLFAGAANAYAGSNSINLSQSTTYTALPGGGAFSGEDPAGGSMAVNSLGVVVAGDTYGGDVVEFAPPSYTATKIEPSGASENVGAVAIDSSNFLYVADQYNNNIIKIPMNADGTYTMTVSTEGSVGSLTACLGDTKGDASGECLIGNPGTALGGFGVSSMTFSSSGALFFATDDQGDTGGVGPAYTIYDCNALCLYGTTAPTLIFAEAVTPAGSVATVGQPYIGGLALDAYGNLFFTDSWETNGSNASAQSNLWELPVVTKAINPTLFAAAPLQILNLTNATPGNYDNAIDAVATDSQGELIVSVLYSGIYGLNDNMSLNGSSTGAQTASATSLYGIGNQVQTKLLVTNSNGGFALGDVSGGGDTLYYITGSAVKFAGPETVGTAENVSLVAADNTSACTPTLTFTSTDPAFTGVITPAGTCSNMFGVAAGSFTPVTLTYTPTVTGFAASTLTVSDTTTSASDSQTVSSSGAAVTISQGTYGAKLPAGGAWGGPSPDGHTGAINSKGVLVFGTGYGNDITMYTLVNGVTTLFGGTAGNGIAGTFNGAGAVAIDKQDNLYISSEYGSTIYKVAPNAADGSYGPWTADTNSNPLNSGGTAPVTCDGTSDDVTAGICAISLGAGNFNFGIAGMVVDGSGNLFFTSDNQATSSNGTYAPDTVFACNTTCLYGASSGNIVALYAEPTAGAGNPQLVPGSISIDSADNVFFTDYSLSAIGTEYSLYSDVNVLPVDASNVSTGYAANPTQLTTLTPSCTNLAGCNYNDAITTVSVDGSGNVFFGTPYDGVYELANNSGTLSTIPWAVSGQSTKTIVPDGNGNFYFINYNSGDDTGYLTLGSVTVNTSANPAQPGTPTTVTNVSAIDNGASCTVGQGNLSFTAVDTDFSAVETAGSNCGDLPFSAGAKFSVSVSLNPSAAASGAVSTTITATNSNSGDTGTALVSGFAAVAQIITFTNPAASESIPYSTTPIVLAATGGASGNAVTFAVTSGPGTLAGDGVTLTITGVGPIVITASQAGGMVGGVTYAPGTGSITITVTQAPQVIASTCAASVAYSASAVNLASCTAGGGGDQPVTFTLVSGPTGASVTNAGALTLGGVGSIVVNADQAASTNGDYAAATTLPISIAVTPGAQTITITAPAGTSSGSPMAIALNGTSALTATASSGATVTFSVDSNSTAGAGSISGSTLTATGVGTIIVDANAAASGNYAAGSAQAFFSVASLGVTAAPTFSPITGATLSTSGTGNNLVTLADATSGAVIWYTTDGSSPITNPNNTATQYSTPFALTASGTVMAVAIAPGYTASTVASATYTVVPTAPAFTAASSAGTSTSSPITITSTTPGTLTLTLTPSSGFDQAITLSCTASTGITVTCSFSPASPITPNGTDAAIPVTVTMTKGSGSAALQKGTNPFLPGGVTFALALGLFGWRKRRGLLLALVVALGTIGMVQMTACGGSSGKAGTVTIGATGGGTTTSTVVNVLVK